MAQFRPSRLAASNVAVLISGLVLVQTAAAQGLNTEGSGSGSTPSPMFGELYGSSAQCAIQRSVSQFQMLARLIGHIDGGEGATVYELSQSAPGTSQTNGYGDTSWDVSQDGGQTLIRGQNPAGVGCAWETWANGYDLGANVDRSTVAHDLDYTVSGAQFGRTASSTVAPCWAPLAAVRLQCIDVSAADRTADINSGQLGAFLRRGEAGDYWLLGGAVAYDSYDTQRQSPTNPANIARGGLMAPRRSRISNAAGRSGSERSRWSPPPLCNTPGCTKRASAKQARLGGPVVRGGQYVIAADHPWR